MNGAKSILDGLLVGMKELTSGPGVSELGQRAKSAWDGQSTLAKGAIAGGLLGVLFTGSGRRLLGAGVEIGGAALIGGLAMKAYESWKTGAEPDQTTTTLPSPTGTAFLPQDATQADDLSARLLQAMVAAAKADGHVTPEERIRIDTQLFHLGLGAEAQALIAAELDSPFDVGRIANLARGPEEASAIYTASRLVVNPEGAAEKGYLALLAARLGLDAKLVAHLDAAAAKLG